MQVISTRKIQSGQYNYPPKDKAKIKSKVKKKDALENIDRILKISTKVVNKKDRFLLKFSRCYLCGEYLNPYTSNVDHIIPKSKYGMRNSCNTKAVHTRCNLLKSNIELSDRDKIYAIDLNAFYPKKDKILLMLLRKLIPTFPENAIIDYKDTHKAVSLLKLYKMPHTYNELNKVYVGFVPKEAISKVRLDYIFTDGEMFKLRNHLKAVLHSSVLA